MVRTTWTFLVISFLFLSFYSSRQSACKLTIEIVNAKNDKGNVKLALYNSKDGFPKEGNKAYKTAVISLKDKKGLIEFSDLPHGEYAAAVLHDMNDNKKMDFHFYGAPKEGYGASNDATGTFGPPSFEEARFVLNNSVQKIVIRLKYF